MKNEYIVVYFQDSQQSIKFFKDKTSLKAFLENFKVIEPGDEIAYVFYGRQLLLTEPVQKLSYELAETDSEKAKP